MNISGDKIKSLRNVFGVNQKQLAKRVKISQGYLARLEQGRQTPSIAIAGRIASAFGLTVEKICK